MAGKPRPYEDKIGEDGLIRYRFRGTDPSHRDNAGLRVAMQRRVLRDALHLAETATRGGTLVDLPYAWGEDFTPSVDRTLGAMSPAAKS